MRLRLHEIEWFRFCDRASSEWKVLFTAPGLCSHWDDSWAGICVHAEQTIYLDPRPTVHGKFGFQETVLHEIMHVIRGCDVDLRVDEPFIRSLSPELFRIVSPVFPPLPAGLDRLRQRAYKYSSRNDPEPQ